ncbi:discoidin domain-containing protein [Streptomyces sp. NPDC101160]|uniref:discoidin domain-containing protein n=1 Tax=Streptomyces sp. NPDC101160 TaxID=3366118 RepID=UPI00381AE963
MRIPRPLVGLASALALLCAIPATLAASPAAAATSLPKPDHIVVVMMENENYDTIIGNTAQAPYINHLAQSGASFSDAHGEWHPSLPNYYALLSGSTQGLTNSTPPAPGSINADNLPNELIQHGYSFASYGDEYTPAAFLRYADLPGTATAPNPVDKWLTCPPSVAGQACGFPTDAAGYAALPTVTFAHGNGAESMHDGDIPGGDSWVKNTFGGYAEWAKTHNSLLVVTWDEDNFTPANHMPTVFYGAGVRTGSYSETINHYSMLRTIEDMYGLPYLANDASATPITDIWSSVTIADPGRQVTGLNYSASLQLQGIDQAGGTLSWSATGLPAGLTVNSSTGLISGIVTSAGSSTVKVTATDSATGASNTASFTWEVPGADLARNRPTTASSVYSASYPANQATDGNPATRWSSFFADPQWIQVDLGSTQSIDTVKLSWEAGYAKAYQIQVSNDGTTWQTIHSTTNGRGGVETLTGLVGDGRYIRMYGTQRGAPYGYSLWSFEVYGQPDLAYNRPTTASSEYSASYPAKSATDGNGTTRWSSLYADPQWLQVDLGSTRSVSAVKLAWQAAYGKAYQIQVSDDGTNWTTIHTATNSGGGIETLTGLSGSGRYIRMYGTQRGTGWGYSLWNFTVYGT